MSYNRHQIRKENQFSDLILNRYEKKPFSKIREGLYNIVNYKNMGFPLIRTFFTLTLHLTFEIVSLLNQNTHHVIALILRDCLVLISYHVQEQKYCLPHVLWKVYEQ